MSTKVSQLCCDRLAMPPNDRVRTPEKAHPVAGQHDMSATSLLQKYRYRSRLKRRIDIICMRMHNCNVCMWCTWRYTRPVEDDSMQLPPPSSWASSTWICTAMARSDDGVWRASLGQGFGVRRFGVRKWCKLSNRSPLPEQHSTSVVQRPFWEHFKMIPGAVVKR